MQNQIRTPLEEALPSVAPPRWAIEILCALAFTAAAILVRLLVNLIAPGAGPYALIYPAALCATLVAGWRSGTITFLLLTLLSWLVVVRGQEDGAISAAEAVNLVLYGAGVVVVIAVAEGFRRAHDHTRRERAARLAEQQLLLSELNHRVKNNFQMVASLLEMQRRRSKDPATVAALEDVLRRVRSMAQAQTALYHDPAQVDAVDLQKYLKELCASLADSLLLTGDVRLECDAESASMSRDRAVAVGMIVNELVTNAAKYAFPGERGGVVRVQFAKSSQGWRLTVSDDGIGMNDDKAGKGLGKRLIEAFAKQAGGTVSAGPGPGATIILDLPA
jgi:two-component sensor histidine kinase